MVQSGVPQQGSEEGILDPATLQQLLDLDDGELNLVQEMVQLFLEDTPLRITALEAAIQSGNGEDLGDVAHAVKGAASTMGALRVRTVALAMETLGRTGKGSESAEVLLVRLKDEFQRAMDALYSFIRSQGGEVPNRP